MGAHRYGISLRVEHGKAATTQTKREHIEDRIQQDQAEAEATTQNLRRTKNIQNDRRSIKIQNLSWF